MIPNDFCADHRFETSGFPLRLGKRQWPCFAPRSKVNGVHMVPDLHASYGSYWRICAYNTAIG